MQRITRPLTEADLDARAENLGLAKRTGACPHSTATPTTPCDCGDPWACGSEMACTTGIDNNPPRRGLLRELWAFLKARKPYLKR